MLIYEALNKVNGKVYIGLTTKTLKQRMSSHLRSAKSGSQTYFHKALRKYGSDNFEWCIILTTNSAENLYKLERMVISDYEDWQTYNCSSGGEFPALGMRHTESTKSLCGEHAKRRWDNKRAKDLYPSFVFSLPSYREASAYGVPKTTWYRYRKG